MASDYSYLCDMFSTLQDARHALEQAAQYVRKHGGNTTRYNTLKNHLLDVIVETRQLLKHTDTESENITVESEGNGVSVFVKTVRGDLNINSIITPEQFDACYEDDSNDDQY